MLNAQDILWSDISLRLRRRPVILLAFFILLMLLLSQLGHAERSTIEAITTRWSPGLICPSGDAQVTRYAGQSISMGCSCNAGYNTITGDAPLGPVEWEICK